MTAESRRTLELLGRPEWVFTRLSELGARCEPIGRDVATESDLLNVLNQWCWTHARCRDWATRRVVNRNGYDPPFGIHWGAGVFEWFAPVHAGVSALHSRALQLSYVLREPPRVAATNPDRADLGRGQSGRCSATVPRLEWCELERAIEERVRRCLAHDDCLRTPDLGAACFRERPPLLGVDPITLRIEPVTR